MTSIYSFSAQGLAGGEVALSRYEGQVLLVVNVASECGFTPQYQGLEALYREYRERGFAVLGFPCDQFGHQEPGSADEIASFCSTNYGVSFPMFAKIEVNGPQAHPLFAWLKSEKAGVLGSQNIKWNFTKFLLGRDGRVLQRYGSITKPEALRGDIEKALAAQA
ncbi:MAG: glutathione peroxidase [Pollutimonas bauzanensis]|uniref:Glutathione peroxidase n=1 Tax=Pollutimonas bauzanensis TaxID=658167 RepID=A0A1M5WHP2_9BURK|nr:glutathione peroxidase [Pollutimonas bauzanensis]SHH86704.1 glutathione peroxidase [Pollutimonas bauzanensis]